MTRQYRSRSRTGLHPIAIVGVMVLGAIVVGALVAVALPKSSFPPERTVGWKLNYGYMGPGFDPATAGTTTVVPVEVTRPVCAPNDLSWLGTPNISYASSAVTIQLRMSDAFDAAKCTSVDKAGRLPVVGFYLSGIYLAVQLKEPLAGRALLDGSMSPPAARPYP